MDRARNDGEKMCDEKDGKHAGRRRGRDRETSVNSRLVTRKMLGATAALPVCVSMSVCIWEEQEVQKPKHRGLCPLIIVQFN